MMSLSMRMAIIRDLVYVPDGEGVGVDKTRGPVSCSSQQNGLHWKPLFHFKPIKPNTMKQFKSLFGVVVVLGALLLTSCTQRILDFTIISSKNIDLSKGASFERGSERVEGIDKVHIIVGFPTGTPNIKEAIDRAIESVPGAVALLDGVLSYSSWNAIFYGQIKYIVEGTPLIDPALTDGTIDGYDEFVELKMNRQGEVVKTVPLTEDQFSAKKKRLQKRLDQQASI